jgi:Na+/proline symporter
MESWVVATGAVLLYILVTIVLGVLANRAMSVDLEDFLLYGRKAGFVVLYLTVVATYHSAFAFLGSGGFFYRHGIGFWEAGTWIVLTGAITYTLGVRIWALGKRFSYITPADMLAGVGVGLAVLYMTLVTVPHALGVHGAIWSLAANFATCITVSALTRPPSPETIERIHGAVEDYAYGSGEAGLEEALRRA